MKNKNNVFKNISLYDINSSSAWTEVKNKLYIAVTPENLIFISRKTGMERRYEGFLSHGNERCSCLTTVNSS